MNRFEDQGSGDWVLWSVALGAALAAHVGAVALVAALGGGAAQPSHRTRISISTFQSTPAQAPVATSVASAPSTPVEAPTPAPATPEAITPRRSIAPPPSHP